MQADGPWRVGQGYDVHALADGRSLILGGVRIDHPRGLAGHSDADVLTHAIIDALLGAAGIRDIGHLFPDTDPAWKDADSIDLLRQVVAQLDARRLGIVNVDATVIAQAPRLAPHMPAMIARLSAAMGVAPERINLKATTTERLGFAGREEGIAAMAVALLAQLPDSK